ncbi:Uncharacterised protein [Canicola haemoglobinophilus]|uniref:Lipoprotein n=1 Tax=Canicola haemoglobinophilus TaxID=733 RepID=A0AB38HAW1_9PAST|nr:hypothetical protein [Canicola haemoglobinophilus]STO55036.1 Uncharacterised protein [Canicola haemoglobinophilus]STO69393.1 Uncharacterised protein [Canicola haemoglobinophilus]
MKFLKLFISVLLLSGCYYSFEDGCLYNFQQVTCYDGASDITRLQKKENIGFTDAEARWQDLESCGGVRVKDGNFEIYIYRDFEKEDKNPNYEKYREKYYELYFDREEYEKDINKNSYQDSREIKPIFNPTIISYAIYMSEVYSCMRRKGYVDLSRTECYQNKGICR